MADHPEDRIEPLEPTPRKTRNPHPRKSISSRSHYRRGRSRKKGCDLFRCRLCPVGQGGVRARHDRALLVEDVVAHRGIYPPGAVPYCPGRRGRPPSLGVCRPTPPRWPSCPSAPPTSRHRCSSTCRAMESIGATGCCQQGGRRAGHQRLPGTRAVPPVGLEPTTFGLKVRSSDRLS